MRLGTIQVDLDSHWVLSQCLGYQDPLSPDPLYETAPLKFLDLFQRHDVKATFFVNACDLEVPYKKKIIQKMDAEGHEIANHGYHHSFFGQLSYSQKEEEIKKSTDMISQCLGKPVRGFRAAAFNTDKDVLELLQKYNYWYDSSVWPTSIVFLFYLWKLIYEKKISTPLPLLGSMRAPLYPYFPHSQNPYIKGSCPVLEIPVTTLPFFRLPIHFSYGAMLGFSYLKFGLSYASWFNIPMNYVFHLFDIDSIHDSRIQAFQWSCIPGEKRKLAFEKILFFLKQKYYFVSCSELYRKIVNK